MINLINKILGKKNISDTSYFYKYVTACNIFNMCFNLTLFLLKIICSYISNSSVIAADAYSDLVDVLSTLISIYALWIAKIAVDCISDGLMASCILFSIFLSKFMAIRHADIWMGFIVSMFIIVSAYRTLRRIANRIIGLDITPKFANDIENLLKVAPFGFTVYDLVAHDYGLQRMFISMQLVGSAQSELALSYWAHQINIDLHDVQSVL